MQNKIHRLNTPPIFPVLDGPRRLQDIEPSQDILLALPMEEFFYFWIVGQERFHVLYELLLHFPANSEIEMEVDGCGLDVVMAEVVFDICKRLAA